MVAGHWGCPWWCWAPGVRLSAGTSANLSLSRKATRGRLGAGALRVLLLWKKQRGLEGQAFGFLCFPSGRVEGGLLISCHLVGWFVRTVTESFAFSLCSCDREKTGNSVAQSSSGSTCCISLSPLNFLLTCLTSFFTLFISLFGSVELCSFAVVVQLGFSSPVSNSCLLAFLSLSLFPSPPEPPSRVKPRLGYLTAASPFPR